MNVPAIRVLVVEDHPALAANIAEFLESGGYELDFAADGLVALHLLATNTYDVIVMDVMLPGLSGFVLCERIRHDLQCATPIILITAKDQLEDKATGFARGADDYLVKPFHLRELAMRIDALHRRGASAASVLRAGPIQFEPGTLRLRLAGAAPLELTGVSARIMEALMRAYPNYLSYQQLGEALGGRTRESDSHALRTHVYVLRKLLQERLGDPLIKTLHGRGYRLAVPGED